MNDRRKIIFFTLFFIFLLFTLIISIFFINNHFANTGKIEKELSKTDQDPRHYLPLEKNSTISNSADPALTQTFLKIYFSPWNQNNTKNLTLNKIFLKEIKDYFNMMLENPGWGGNYHPLPKDFIPKLLRNASLENFPNINQPGIVVHSSLVRTLPTLLPSYNNPGLAGQGYPFDNLQESFIAENTPIKILHQSRDGLWFFIKTSSYDGWILASNVGFVSEAFINKWKNLPYVVATSDNTPLFYLKKQWIASSMRMGILYPLEKKEGDFNEVLIPILNQRGYAKSLTLKTVSNVEAFPLKLTPQNIAQLLKQFIGMPYGWGGLYGLRDCSATMQDLFASFGFWLPRSSSDQFEFGKVISLAHKTPEEKSRLILQKGVPFLTLIHFPGHIALYIGTKQGKIYIAQDFWGLHTSNFLGHEGRIVIGDTLITPIDLGTQYVNVKTLLERADHFTILKI